MYVVYFNPINSFTNLIDELGQWAPACNRFGFEYVQGYHSHLPISSPVEDYQGRIDLYKLCVCRVPAHPVYQTTQLEILGDSTHMSRLSSPKIQIFEISTQQTIVGFELHGQAS
jgi:protein-ribulosamine 3-kinase